MKEIESYLLRNSLDSLFHPISKYLAITKSKIILDFRTNTLVFTTFLYGKEIVCGLNENTISAVGFKLEINLKDLSNLSKSLIHELDVLDVRIQKINEKWYLLSDELVDYSKKFYYPPTIDLN